MSESPYPSSLDPSPEDSDDSESLLHFSTLSIEDRMRNGVIDVYPDVVEIFVDLNFPFDSYKDEQEAVDYKNITAMLYSTGQGNKAMKNILLSINLCPDTINLDYSLGFRSWILFSMSDYISALVDINRILRSKRGPADFVFQMNKQKTRCITEASTKLQDMTYFKHQQHRTITNPDVYNTTMYLIKLFRRKLKFRPDDIDINFNKSFRIPTIYSKNNLLPNASSKIKIARNVVKKRFVQAVTDISIGEVLIVEKPLVCMIYSNNVLTHCSHCFVRCTALIPCEVCSLMFCSEACYNEAKDRYHRFECRFFQHVEAQKLTVTIFKLIVLRLFLMATMDGTQLRNLMNDEVYGNPCSNKDFNYDEVYVPEDYFNIHNLEDNADKVTPDTWHAYSVQASFLLLCLKKMSFFDQLQAEQNENVLSELESYAGSLLLKFTLCIAVNVHEVVEYVDLPEIADKEHSVGIALYPTVRFANHSCDQNLLRFFHKNYIVVRSLRSISAGEELFDNYGTFYWNSTLKKRQSFFKKHYYFKCECIACEENWPLLTDLPFDFSVAPCLIPREEINMDQVREWAQKYSDLEPGFSNQTLAFYYMYLNFLYKTFQKPFKEQVLVQNSIQLLLSYRGNYYNHTIDTLLDFEYPNV